MPNVISTPMSRTTTQPPSSDPVDLMREAALARLARRQMAEGEKGTAKSGQGAMLGGIVGAILGAKAGNPMMGYSIGSQLGSAAGKGQLDTETIMGLAPSLLRQLMANPSSGGM